MNTQLSWRFWFESLAAAVSTGSFLLTVLWKDWIELLFGLDPDHANGSIEWGITALALAASLTFFFMARHEWRRVAAVNPTRAWSSGQSSILSRWPEERTSG